MKAMQLRHLGQINESTAPLDMVEIDPVEPGDHQVLIKVNACAVCHTELDEIEGRTPPPVLPVIPGHQVVGEIIGQGADANLHQTGELVGVGWIGGACGSCDLCQRGLENLCPEFTATGRDINGGYAQYIVIDENFAHRIPEGVTAQQAAPLLCAGAIGYRSLSLCEVENGQILGLTGFGGSGHLVLQLAQHLLPDSPVYVFARSPREREFALELGADWAGDTSDRPPRLTQAIIDTTPAWQPVLSALEVLAPGGRLVINAIRKEEGDKAMLTTLDYPSQLWKEKEIKSVANVAREDIRQFLAIAAEAGIRPEIQEFPLEDANAALLELKFGHVRGAKVLRMEAV
jgi:propanol-preferring alcohol dehydrogenase